jgi:hypothetical protein
MYLQFIKQQSTWRIVLVDIADADFVNEPAHYKTIAALLDTDIAPGVMRIKVG